MDASPRALRGPGRAPFTDDPRQKTLFAAAWTLGLVASAAQAGLTSLTLFELAGPRGVQDEGGGFPVLDALADVAAIEGARVVPARPRRPERIQALALQSGGRVRLLLANVTGEGAPGPRRGPLRQRRSAPSSRNPKERRPASSSSSSPAKW